jgi:hypothetical protein
MRLATANEGHEMIRHQTEESLGNKPFYTLLIGNTEDKPFDPQKRAEIFRLVFARFPSFTALDAQGYYKGKPLPTIQIQIATKDHYSLSVLCQELGLSLDQKSIGLVQNGIFQNVKVIDPDKDKNAKAVLTSQQHARSCHCHGT